MNELKINKHSFEVAKERLKEFSENKSKDLIIDKVKIDGGFLGLGEHKVTGRELNHSLETIQEHLMSINTINNKVVREFSEVYKALDVLDNDYITSIVANVKAIEKTSNDIRTQQGVLKKHNDKLADQQNELDLHQIEIEKNISNISKVVKILKEFKEKLESYQHLAEVDSLWSDLKNMQNVAEIFEERLSDHSEAIDGVSKHLEETSELIAVNKGFIVANEDAITTNRESISANEKSIAVNRESITELEVFKDKVSNMNHLMEVDNIFQQVNEHEQQLIQLTVDSNTHEQTLVELSKVDNQLREQTVTNQQDIHSLKEYSEMLSKNIRYAYWLAGGATSIAVMELILILLKVI